MIKVKDVSKSYGQEQVLDDVSVKFNDGINYVVGKSGSGKTTLLKIIAGVIKDYTGEVLIYDIDIKLLNNRQYSSLLNDVVGFVWQDLNLVDEYTVLENILLPTMIGDNADVLVNEILKDLKLTKLKDQLASTLSGGQKQRVALARELIKDPKYLLLDEPTSNLDKVSKKIVNNTLVKYSKNRTIVIITHDNNEIEKDSKVFNIVDGKIECEDKVHVLDTKVISDLKLDSLKLSFNSAFELLKINVTRKSKTYLMTIVSIIFATLLFISPFSSALNAQGNSEIDNIIELYGPNVLDISIAGSFMSASGTGSDESGPNGDVEQDINGIYDRYINDERVEHIIVNQPLNDIVVEFNGEVVNVESSGNVPVLNKVISGRVPKGSGSEVVVPEGFVSKLGLDNESVLNKEIKVKANVYQWVNDQPVPVSVETTARIVGVINTDIVTEYEGEFFTYTIDDSFIFDKATVDDLRKQASIDAKESMFSIRAKTAFDVISIKNELNAEGIVPLGQFTILEDIVNLSNQTTEQSNSSRTIMISMSIVIVIAMITLMSILSKKYYAILMNSGFSHLNLFKINLIEALMLSVSNFILSLFLINLIQITKLMSLSFTFTQMLTLVSSFSLFVFITYTLISSIIAFNTNVSVTLKSGDK